MHNSKDSLRDLLVPERSNRLLETAERLVQDMLEQPGEFAVWGAGNSGIYTRRFLEERSGGVLRPSYIVDNNSSLWGRDNIISPEEFFQLPDCPKRLIIAVYVADQVLEQLKGFSYDGAVDCLNMVAYYRAGDLWSIYEEHFHQLEETYNLLSDDRSRSTFAGFLNYVRTLDDRYLAQINGDSRDKLMDPSILRPGKQECFLDVGAFTGDTIVSFLRSTQGAYQSITAFEPDVENYRALCQFADKSGLEHITLKRMAAGRENGVLHFETGVSESCRLSESGTCAVEVCRLDSLPEAQDATILKISANGAEMDVLRGAEGLLLQNSLKISTYTSGSLLWEIPQYLKKQNPNYQLHFRHYGFGLQAMTCYAIPDGMEG